MGVGYGGVHMYFMVVILEKDKYTNVIRSLTELYHFLE
jgi:hypothetical protein